MQLVCYFQAVAGCHDLSLGSAKHLCWVQVLNCILEDEPSDSDDDSEESSEDEGGLPLSHWPHTKH